MSELELAGAGRNAGGLEGVGLGEKIKAQVCRGQIEKHRVGEGG